MKNQNTKRLAYAALFLALCLVLPMLTGQIPQIGSMLLPMHIPVLLCGLVCGWQYGAAVGFVGPLLRSVLFVMPPMYPVAIAMAFELLTYGLVIGLVYRRMAQKGLAGVYAALLTAMVAGRLVWGMAEVVLLGLGGKAFTAQAFLAGALLRAGHYRAVGSDPRRDGGSAEGRGRQRIRRIRKFAGRLRRKRSLFALCSCIAVHFSHTATGIAGPVFAQSKTTKSLQVQAFLPFLASFLLL